MLTSFYVHATVYSHFNRSISNINILVVCPCVRDGCGRGRNGFAGRVQNHHVRFSFHVHRTKNGHLEIVKTAVKIVKTAAKLLLQDWTLCVAGYAKDAIVGTYHRTSNGQEHKIILRAGLERDTIFHLRVTACREQGSHCHD